VLIFLFFDGEGADEGEEFVESEATLCLRRVGVFSKIGGRT
jgi:hypothetical protein